MMISQIVAVSKNFVIGNQGKIPWHSSADFQFFKKTTMGKPIIMGRKTYASIGKPLPGRLNIVITRSPDTLNVPNSVVMVSNIEDAIQRAKQEDVEEIFIIGGATIYEQTKDITQKLYLTVVDVEAQGDAHFDKSYLDRFELTKTLEYTDTTPHLSWRTYSKLPT